MLQTSLLSLGLVLATSQLGHAQDERERIEEGQRLAAIWCNNCHLTGAGTQGRAADAAPSFRSIARMPSTSALSLHAFLQTPHALMPDYHLSREEQDGLVAYILSLKEPARR